MQDSEMQHSALPTQRRLTCIVAATPLMSITTDLGLFISVSMFEYVRLVIGT